MRLKIISIVLFVMTTSVPASAGLFYEHKLIGDSALKMFIRLNNLEKFFRDTVNLRQFGRDYKIPYADNPEVKQYYNGMFGISNNPNSKLVYSYGDLCGLAADHSLDAIQLFEGLFATALYSEVCPGLEKYESLLKEIGRALECHRKAIEIGDREGKYFFLRYALLADEDRSHFLQPPASLKDMLSQTDTAFLNLAFNLFSHGCDSSGAIVYEYRKQFDNKILKINNPTKYAILHLIALHFMHYAAIDYYENPNLVKEDIKLALMFNSFADHFLQDAFAAGHMSVVRTWRGLNNKGTHDYYNRVGLSVSNKLGQQWHTYGDSSYDSTTFAMAINANIRSLQELWDVFMETKTKVNNLIQSGSEDLPYLSLFDSLRLGIIKPGDSAISVLENFRAFQYSPIPLTKDDYKKNKLKAGSKSGGFIDVAYGKFFDSFSNNRNYVLSFTLAPIGYLLKQPDRGGNEKMESVFWIGLGVNYNYVSFPDNTKNQFTIKIPFSFYDKVVADISIGNSRFDSENHLLFSSSLGYEWKALQNFWAPSLNLFLNTEKNSSAVTGIRFNLRFY
jgi:hypothetical protein